MEGEAVKRFWLALAFLAAWAACATWTEVGAQDAAAPATNVATRAAEVKGSADAAALGAKGIEAVRAGKFRLGLKLLAQARALGSDDVIAHAESLTEEYLKALAKNEGERRAEYDAAVRRVGLAWLARKHHDVLVQAKLVRVARSDDDKGDKGEAGVNAYKIDGEEADGEGDDDKTEEDGLLYTGVAAVADALAAADKLLSSAPTSRPADLGKTASEHLDKAVAELKKTVAGAAEAPDLWRKSFKRAGERCRLALAAYREKWSDASLPADRQELKGASEKARDALIDMGVLVSRDPLLTALTHAREVRELSDNSDEFLKLPWMKLLIGQAEKRGAQLVAKGEWYEALSVYGRGGLSGIDEDNEKYKDIVKRVNLHVRVIALYGNGGEPPEDPDEAIQPRWKEMMQHVDSAMVQSAITQMDRNYVKAPDYRKIVIGALVGVKVLAETAEARITFASLKNGEKLQAFVAGVNKQIEKVGKDPVVDRITVSQALRQTLELNDETVELPSEVINVEFAESMVAKLDRFSSMIWPYEMEEFSKRTMGSFFGIGVQIRQDPGSAIEVIAPLADTPAFRAGIRAGDMIEKVDGKETKKIPMNASVKMIMGVRHTEVVLTIRRAGVPKPFDVTILRDKIHIRTVKGWRRLADGRWDYMIDPDAGIAYIRLTQFTEDTAGSEKDPMGDLQRALQAVRQAGGKRLILDLRFNPGGLLRSANRTANEFLRRGLIVRTQGRNTREEKHNANPLGGFLKGEMVVLVNQASASAAEIVAGALKDWGRARIVGERTYGKGSVQRLIPINKTGMARLKLTTAYYYLPSGRCLHRTNGSKTWGVDPDLKMPTTIRQTNRWAELRQETELLKEIDAATLETLLAHQLREDLQLQTALLLLRLGHLKGRS